MSKPIERAAEAMHALSNSDPWERQHEYVRQEFRDDARAAFESIDVEELVRVIEDADDALLAAGQVPATYLYPEAYQEIARRVKAWLVGEGS